MADQHIYELLGEIKGTLEMVRETQSAHGEKIDSINGRLSKVEHKAATNGLVTGSIAAIGVSFIRHKMGL